MMYLLQKLPKVHSYSCFKILQNNKLLVLVSHFFSIHIDLFIHYEGT